MKFQIRGQSVDVDLTSVILEYNPILDENETLESLILWHCPICNQPLFQYSGKVIMIVPGKTPTKIPVIVNCEKCHHKYLINSIL